MQKQLTSPPTVPAVSIDAVRVRARAVLHRDLVKYFSQPGRTHQRPLDLAPLFSQYGLALLDAMALREAGLTANHVDYKRTLDQIAGVVLDEIRPPTDGALATLEELLHRPEPTLPDQPVGVWEVEISRAWTEARWSLGGQNPTQSMDVHPFERVLRQPVLGNAVIAALGSAIRNQLPELEARFLDRNVERVMKSEADTPDEHNGSANPSNRRAAFVMPRLEKKGWSILDWATESGVDHKTASKYLKGLSNPYRSSRMKLAASLGCEAGELPE